jgi:hypothetical protein
VTIQAQAQWHSENMCNLLASIESVLRTTLVILCLVFLVNQFAFAAHFENNDANPQPGIAESSAAGVSSCATTKGLCCQTCIVILNRKHGDDVLPRLNAGERLRYRADLVEGLVPKPLEKPPRRII